MFYVRRTIIAISVVLLMLFAVSQFVQSAFTVNRVIGVVSRSYVALWQRRLPLWGPLRFHFFGYRSQYDDVIAPSYRIDTESFIFMPWWLVFAAWAPVAVPFWLFCGRKRKSISAAFPVEMTTSAYPDDEIGPQPSAAEKNETRISTLATHGRLCADDRATRRGGAGLCDVVAEAVVGAQHALAIEACLLTFDEP